jgi:hypothetical protein
VAEKNPPSFLRRRKKKVGWGERGGIPIGRTAKEEEEEKKEKKKNEEKEEEEEKQEEMGKKIFQN